MIDGVNALIIQLHQTLSLRDAGTSADVDTDDTVFRVVVILLPVVILVLPLIIVPILAVLKWNNFYNSKASDFPRLCYLFSK